MLFSCSFLTIQEDDCNLVEHKQMERNENVTNLLWNGIACKAR